MRYEEGNVSLLISGTDYRKKLIKKEIYEYANTDLQKYLLNESILKYE